MTYYTIGDDGQREWACPHGIGHPWNRAGDYGHTCDGCCGLGNPVYIAFTLPRAEVLTANQRPHHMARHRMTKALRTRAAAAARAGRLSERGFVRAHCFAWLTFPDGRRRDPDNWAPTLKALIDGIVTDGGLLPDDDAAHLIGPDKRITDDRCERGTVVVELRFYPLEVTP